MGKIEIFRGDITQLSVDVIVNAANRSLLGGGGVDGAIHRAAGPELLKSCEELHGCNTGGAKITQGFKLPSKYVIHAVGPVWENGKHNESDLLASCYWQSLRLATVHGLRTIAFPNISTGIYGFPKQKAALIAYQTVQNFLHNTTEIDLVIFCCFDEENFKIYSDMTSYNTVIKQVISPEEIFITSNLAATIWYEYYISIISQEQIDYMVNKFQSPEAIENQIKGDCYQYYIIYHDSVPSGYISIKPSENELFLSKFYVIKEKRGTGLGRKGIEFISEKAKECGARTITLTVNKNNISSIKAYEKLGFVNGGPVVADIGNGYVMDDFRMSLKL